MAIGRYHEDLSAPDKLARGLAVADKPMQLSADVGPQENAVATASHDPT